MPQPLLPIRVFHRQKATPPILALVDSGADVSAFHVSVPEQLGIDLTTCGRSRLRGVGGPVDAFGCEVEMEIEGRRFPAEVRFVPTRTALLGRHDVFLQFVFAFDQRARTLFVEPY